MAQELYQKEQNSLLRSLTVLDSDLADFVSNDYLGLAASEEIASVTQEILQKYNLQYVNGSKGSRLLAGHSAFAADLETYLANFYEGEAALVCNSGYTANTSLLGAIPQRSDALVYDESIHASLKEGARLSFAERISFKHNNLEHLERRLQALEKPAIIVVESLYSMDGDFANLPEIARLANEYNAALIVDEAHTTGIAGQEGKGLSIESGIQTNCLARVYTYGKGPGSHGAVIIGDKVMVDYLVNNARPFIYTTALPPHSLANIWAATLVFSRSNEARQQLNLNIATFVTCNAGKGNLDSPIQFVMVGSPVKAKELASRCQAQGFAVKAVVAPTVPAGMEGLRIIIHSYNTHTQIERLCKLLNTEEQ